MPKKKSPLPVSREKLLAAMQNIPEDAQLLVGTAVHDEEDFLQGLCLNRSQFFTKEQVLAEIHASSFQEFPSIPEHINNLLITPRLYVWRNSINHSQRFPATPEAENYVHVVDKGNPYYDIFFRLDKEQETITFALGDAKKEIPVIGGTEWCWKPTRKGLLCSDINRLEKNFLDSFWNPIAVDVGRAVLKIKPVI